jgi:hypothetical protein
VARAKNGVLLRAWHPLQRTRAHDHDLWRKEARGAAEQEQRLLDLN